MTTLESTILFTILVESILCHVESPNAHARESGASSPSRARLYFSTRLSATPSPVRSYIPANVGDGTGGSFRLICFQVSLLSTAEPDTVNDAEVTAASPWTQNEANPCERVTVDTLFPRESPNKRESPVARLPTASQPVSQSAPLYSARTRTLYGTKAQSPSVTVSGSIAFPRESAKEIVGSGNSATVKFTCACPTEESAAK